MIIRIILFLILFYLIYNIGKKFVQFLFKKQGEVSGGSKKKMNKFDPEDIEDIDYEEINRKEYNSDK
jgi:hypothetical protein